MSETALSWRLPELTCSLQQWRWRQRTNGGWQWRTGRATEGPRGAYRPDVSVPTADDASVNVGRLADDDGQRRLRHHWPIGRRRRTATAMTTSDHDDHDGCGDDGPLRRTVMARGISDGGDPNGPGGGSDDNDDGTRICGRVSRSSFLDVPCDTQRRPQHQRRPTRPNTPSRPPPP